MCHYRKKAWGGGRGAGVCPSRMVPVGGGQVEFLWEVVEVMAHLHLCHLQDDVKQQVADHSPPAPPLEQSNPHILSSLLSPPTHCYPHTVPSTCCCLPSVLSSGSHSSRPKESSFPCTGTGLPVDMAPPELRQKTGLFLPGQC